MTYTYRGERRRNEPITRPSCGKLSGVRAHLRYKEHHCAACLRYLEDFTVEGNPRKTLYAPRNAAVVHGRSSGVRFHAKRGEKPCFQCRLYNAERNRRGREKLKASTAGPKRPTVRRDRCGTPSGYIAHCTHNETACEPCTEAHRVQARIYRARQKAQKGTHQ